MALEASDLLVVNKNIDGSLAKVAVRDLAAALSAEVDPTDFSLSFLDKTHISTNLQAYGEYEFIHCISVSVGKQPVSRDYTWLEYNAPTGIGGGGEVPEDATIINGLFGPVKDPYLTGDRISKTKINCKVVLTFDDGATEETMGDWADAFSSPFGDPDQHITDAPADGTLYGRQDNNWVAVTGSSGVVTIQDDAPDLTNYEAGQLWWCSADGNMYVKYVDVDGEPGQWVPVTSSGGGGGSTENNFESALIPDTDSVTIGANDYTNTEVYTQFTGVVAAKIESRWWQFDGDAGETVDDAVPVYEPGSSPSDRVQLWVDHNFDKRLYYRASVDPTVFGIYKSDIIAETRVTYIDGTQVAKFALNSCKVTRL